jgi:hypothetical protein
MRKYVSLLLGTIVAFGVCFFALLGASASADPYPPSPCSTVASDLDECQAVDPTMITRSPSGNSDQKNLASTGTPTVLIGGAAVILLAGGILLTVATRRRPTAH